MVLSSVDLYNSSVSEEFDDVINLEDEVDVVSFKNTNNANGTK